MCVDMSIKTARGTTTDIKSVDSRVGLELIVAGGEDESRL